jgi:hypothetical protein
MPYVNIIPPINLKGSIMKPQATGAGGGKQRPDQKTMPKPTKKTK